MAAGIVLITGLAGTAPAALAAADGAATEPTIGTGAPTPPGVHRDNVPADGHWDPLPPADMADWYAVPVLRERSDGTPAVPGLDVIDLPAHGLAPSDLTTRGVPVIPFASIAEWTNDRIASAGVSSAVLDKIVPNVPSLAPDAQTTSSTSVPAGSTLPISVYYDQSQLDSASWSQTTANNAWSRAVSLYQTQLNIPINRVRLLIGASVPVSDVTTYCQMQTLAKHEMNFTTYGRALVIFSAGTLDGAQGVAIGGDVTETYSHGDSYNYCGNTEGRPYLTPAVIPPVYVSGFMDAWIPGIEFGKTGVDYVTAHEIGHVLTMAHNMGRCWWDSSGLHLHKTLEAFTSGPTRPECGSNANTASHYHWAFNDNYNPAVGEAGINGHEAMTTEWSKFANCQASGWCTVNATPSAPRNVVATPGSGSVTLNWTAPQYQGSGPVVDYCYYRGTSSTFMTDTWSGCTSSTSVTVTGLTNGVRYYFYVRARNGAVGNQGGPRSSYVSAVPAIQHNLTSTAPTIYPSSLSAGQSYQVCWSVSGTGSITHSEINWGTTTALGNLSSSMAGTAPAEGCTTLIAPSSGTVYFRSQATGPSNSVNSVTYSIPVQAAPQNDCGTGGDAGGSHAAATSISLPKSNCTAQLVASTDTQDWYQFSVTNGQTINASMTNNASSDYDICIYNPSGTLVAGCTVGSVGGTDTLNHAATVTGNYRLRVMIWSGTGTYTMSISTTTPPPAHNDCGTGNDAGNSHAAASSISLPKSNCSGALTTSTDVEDWYQFSVTSGQTINASMTNNASSDYDICIYNPSGTLVAGCTVGSVGGTDTLNHAATVTGNYRLRVMIWSGTGTYTMSISTSGGGGGPVTIRDDDNEKDANLPMNYDDDTAVKRLNVTSTQLSGKTTATLYLYGQSYGCTTTGNKYKLRANNNSVADFNPCNEWSSSGFSWKSFNVPISWITAGTNTFNFEYLSGGGDWTSRNVYLGIDSDTDFGRTDAYENGTSLNGELMWYLVLS